MDDLWLTVRESGLAKSFFEAHKLEMEGDVSVRPKVRACGVPHMFASGVISQP